ncbi:hypothetical protein BGX27_006976 [Mortierella sp. AM989]|nr:hypothetical protein BGX27_006976 [Mortierella sp. AM989]
MKKPTEIGLTISNPFRSKVAAGILGGVDNIHNAPGKEVLSLRNASGSTVFYFADIVGPEGLVCAVEFFHHSGRDLIKMVKKRTNVIFIMENVRHSHKHRMLVEMVDVIFVNNNGHVVISTKANCIDLTVDAVTVFAAEIPKLQKQCVKPQE